MEVILAIAVSAGSEFLVNQFTDGYQGDISSARLPGGGFVVVWRSDDGGDGDPDGAVKARIFDAHGVAASEFLVPEIVTGDESFPSVAVLSDGRIAVVWVSRAGSYPTAADWQIKAWLYSPDGQPLTREFLVNEMQAGDQVFPSVAPLADGGFAVTWTDFAGGLGDSG